MTTIGIFDYGAGNLHSLLKALEIDGREVSVESDIRSSLTADVLILPGVGAFGAAAGAVGGAREYLRSALADGTPCVGICLGMQLLFDASEEGGGPGAGVGLIPGTVNRLRTARVPHMGWNEIEWDDAGNAPGTARTCSAYFANAYVCEPDDASVVLGWTTHEDARFPSVVRTANTVGVQFHPEKSAAAGRAFVNGLIDQLLRCR